MSQSFRSRLKDWKLDRRRFLYATGGLAGLVATSPLQALTEKVTPSFSTNPFTLGVASGDPLADSVMLWTRLAVEPLAADGSGGIDPVRVPVQWYVATDDRMRHVVRRGVDLRRSRLRPLGARRRRPSGAGRGYWYQFQVSGEWSPIGRTRTLVPHQDSPQPDPLRVRLVPALRDGLLHRLPAHGAGEPRPGAVPRRLHLRGRRSPALPRQHDGPEPMTVAAYRNRHAVYKSDANLQATHAAFPWLVVFDDHEVENNWAGRFDEDGSAPEISCRAAPPRSRPTTSTCRCAPDRSRAARTSSSSAASRSATWRSSTCSTRGSIATTRPAATAPTSAAPRRSIRTGRSPGPSRKTGCSRA